MAYTINGMITSQEDIQELFGGSAEEPENKEEKKPEETPGGAPSPEQEEQEEVTEVVSPEDLFPGQEEEQPERVGDEEEEIEERVPSKQTGGSSPAKLYSSIANSLAENGTLSNISEEDLKGVKDAESLVAVMKKQVESMLDDTQKRINDALNAGLEVPQVVQYENAIKYLNGITEDALSEESPEGENLRRYIIKQYQLSLGLDETKADKMVERAFSGATDVEDAKEYLEALKKKCNDDYTKYLEEGKNQEKLRKQKQEEDIKKFKDTILKDTSILGDIEVDEKTRQLAFDNWIKPTHKNDKGVYQSAIQKYISEHPMDFQMKVALLFTMTDGFSKMGNVLKQTVKKEKKKAMQELENVVNSTQRTPSGGINFFGKDPDANFNGLQIAPPSSWRQ